MPAPASPPSPSSSWPSSPPPPARSRSSARATISWQGQCLNLSSDEKNCGSPGLACPQGELCVTGSCCSGPTCSPTIFLACFDNAQVRGATASLELVGAPVQVDTGPVSFARRGTELWVANSESNTLDQIGLGFSTPVSSVTIPQSGQFSDLEYLASAGGLLYASNDAVGSLVVVDPAIGPVAESSSGPRATRRESPSARRRRVRTWP